jgi:hypothetical protein
VMYKFARGSLEFSLIMINKLMNYITKGS